MPLIICSPWYNFTTSQNREGQWVWARITPTLSCILVQVWDHLSHFLSIDAHAWISLHFESELERLTLFFITFNHHAFINMFTYTLTLIHTLITTLKFYWCSMEYIDYGRKPPLPHTATPPRFHMRLNFSEVNHSAVYQLSWTEAMIAHFIEIYPTLPWEGLIPAFNFGSNRSIQPVFLSCWLAMDDVSHDLWSPTPVDAVEGALPEEQLPVARHPRWSLYQWVELFTTLPWIIQVWSCSSSRTNSTLFMFDHGLQLMVQLRPAGSSLPLQVLGCLNVAPSL